MPEAVVRKAAQPGGDLACDFALARDVARIRDDLARGIVWPVREIDGGVEVTFRAEAWDAVLRYIEVESQCCTFLDLAAERGGEAVVLRVTGRPEAREFIANIFVRTDAAGCC